MSASIRSRRVLSILATAILIALIPACHSSSEAPGLGVDNIFRGPGLTPLAWTEVEAQVAVFQPMTDVFKSQPAWARFYEQYAFLEGPTPEFDFDEVTLVVVAWGSVGGCPGNFVGSIASVTQGNELVYVAVAPLADFGPCDLGFALKQIIQFPRVDLPIRFVGEVPG